MKTRKRLTIARTYATNSYINAIGRLAPSRVYVVDLRGLNDAAVKGHLKRCCGPALCCSEMIAEQMEARA